MKRKYISLLALSLVAVTTSCNQTPSTPEDDSNNTETPITPISINNVLTELRKGFRTTGTFEITENYFTDNNYQVPDEKLESKTTTYKFDLTYQDSEDYTGLDRRYYEVMTDTNGKSYDGYLMGENAYNLDGYAALKYLDYDNTLKTDLAVDQNGDLIPYGTNNLINPFRLIQRNDLTQTKDGFVLTNEKTNIIFDGLFSLLDGYQDNISYDTRVFDFTESTLNGASFVSRNIDSKISTTVPTEGEPYHQTYVRYNYKIDMEFSEIGTANASNLMKVESEKEENAPLKKAIENMRTKDKLTMTRRIVPYIDGNYVGADTYLSIYQLGGQEGGGIYSQAYTLPPDQAYETPQEPTASDFFLRIDDTSRKMRIYTVNETTGEFSRAGYSNLDNRFYYENACLNFDYLDANIFTLNEDGSYSPNDDNLPYIVRDVFMSTFDTFTPIDSGYVTEVKIYVNEDETCIDRIDVNYEDHVGYSGLFEITFTDLGASKTPFDIVIANEGE